MRQVLFVCTGNVFRSLTAEYALRAALNGRAGIAVASAGTADYAHTVMPEIREYLLSRGLDVSAHRRRTLTQAMVEEAHLVVAMSLDHRDFIRERFGRSVPLFLECCGHGRNAKTRCWTCTKRCSITVPTEAPPSPTCARPWTASSS